ncbi:MAG: hypothetical protein IKS55_02635 [Oscillospiraceae bacterium]|nr:hypothetical protein [Oscillospiraceae bacterium]
MTRELDFRYVIVRDGADYAELQRLDSSTPSLEMDASMEIKTKLSGDYLIPAADVNFLTDEIRPELLIDGFPFNLGVYLPANVQELENRTTRYLHISAYDRCWRVRDNYTESLLHLSAGTNYLTAVETLLTACGIALISTTPTEATLTEDREDWDIGTSYLEIVNQLLSEINYNPLWFDADGTAVLEPASVPTAANIEHTLDDTQVESLMIPAISKELDIYSAPNVFICVCSNADKSGPMVATSENTNPQSPLSIARRGRRIAKVVNVSNIASQEELQAYADRLRNETMITGETIIVKTGLLPGFGVNDVTAVRFGELFAVCLEKAWNMELRVGGSMVHTLEKVVVNLG